MTTPANTPANSHAGDHSHAATPAVLTFEDRLRDYWQKNGQAIMVGVGIVILGVLATVTVTSLLATRGGTAEHAEAPAEPAARS